MVSYVTRRQFVLGLGIVFLGLALALLAAPSWLGTVCLDRRDYAPGMNTYRLIYCEDLRSYQDRALVVPPQ